MKQLLEKYLSLTRAKQIGVAVVLIHVLIIAALIGHHLFTYRSPPKRPIAVRNRVLPKPQMPAKTSTQAKQPAVAVSSPPKQKAKPAPAKPKPAPSQKKSSPKKSASQPLMKEETPLEELAKSLDSLVSQEPISKQTLSIPAKLRPNAEIVEQIENPNYSEQIIAYLQNSLDLPEYGEVKMKITIDRWGTPISCEILESKSKKNGEFLKKRLPELAFPCFNDYALLGNSLEFTIMFRNVETR